MLKNGNTKARNKEGANLMLSKAIKSFGDLKDAERGAFYTKKEIVDFMLDILGYHENKNLYDKSLLDPGFGHGVFIIEAIKRLLLSAKKKKKLNVKTLQDCIRGVEISPISATIVKKTLRKILKDHDFSDSDIEKLLSFWIVEGDYLLSSFQMKFDFIVGNPPYLRVESLDKTLLVEYREKFETMNNRADLYIGFFEHSLNLLKKNGNLSFICSDGWLKNKYGESLRNKINQDFNLNYVLNLHDTYPFSTKVGAYTSIFLIEKRRRVNTLYRKLENISIDLLFQEHKVLDEYRGNKSSRVENSISQQNHWHLESKDIATMLKDFDVLFPTIEEAGLNVGIGIATGCDKVFIIDQGKTDDIEKDRLIKLCMRGDIQGGKLAWSQKYVINTFDENGNVINLNLYPKLKKYFTKNIKVLKNRHVAKKNLKLWFRTIDKPNLSLLKKKRLYIPDIMLDPKILFTTSEYYPHHNLYLITSNQWNLKAFKTLLKSFIGFLYIDSFSTTIKGGYYRYQAQTLRKIRIPHWNNLSTLDQKNLINLNDSQDFDLIDEVVCRIYGFSLKQRDLLLKNNEKFASRLSRLRKNSE